jgi:hypothetical protein
MTSSLSWAAQTTPARLRPVDPIRCLQSALSVLGASGVVTGDTSSIGQSRCVIDRTQNAGERDELFAGVPKLPIIGCQLRQQRKTRTSTPPQVDRQPDIRN